MKQIDLTDRVTVICGAGNGGIGAAVTHALAEYGATLVAVDRTQELADEIAEEVRAKSAGVLPLAVNLMDPIEGGALMDKVRKEFGRIDCLVNVVGGSKKDYWRPTEIYSDAMFAEVFSLNIDATFRTCRDACRLMRENGNGGAIVNFASISALAGAPYHGPYGAAKAGVMALTRTMAQEWWRYGIRVNAIAPGATITPSTLAKGAQRLTNEPFGRTQVDPSEIAATVAFLLSDLASGINGQTLPVDVGVTARHCLGDPSVFDALRAE